MSKSILEFKNGEIFYVALPGNIFLDLSPAFHYIEKLAVEQKIPSSCVGKVFKIDALFQEFGTETFRLTVCHGILSKKKGAVRL